VVALPRSCLGLDWQSTGARLDCAGTCAMLRPAFHSSGQWGVRTRCPRTGAPTLRCQKHERTCGGTRGSSAAQRVGRSSCFGLRGRRARPGVCTRAQADEWVTTIARKARLLGLNIGPVHGEGPDVPSQLEALAARDAVEGERQASWQKWLEVRRFGL
jgi:hypothetical protein